MRKKKPHRKPRLRKTKHTLEEFHRLCSEYKNKCVCCGEKFDLSALTRDHIKSTSKKGKDYIWNIQPMCEECNSAKGSVYRDLRPFIPIWVLEKQDRYKRKNRK